MLLAARDAADKLAAEGHDVTLWDPRVVKPLDAEEPENFSVGAVIQLGRASLTIDAYQINMDSLLGCIAWNPSAVFEGQASSARLQQVGVCQGTRYNVTIRARANGQWGPWSSVLYINSL